MNASHSYRLVVESPVASFHQDSPLPAAAKVASALLFAFPILAVSVRHWASGIYILLCLLALPFAMQGWRTLGREERIFLGVIIAYLASTIISNSASGWTDASIRWYQADLRLVFAIPLFLFLRLHPRCAVGLMRGIPIAGIYIGLHALYDTFLGTGRVDGSYGPIFFGNIAALVTVMSLASLRFGTFTKGIGVPLHILGSAMGLVAVILSGTRSAWLATAVALPLAALFTLHGLRHGRRRFLAGFLAVTAAGVAFGVTEAPDLTKDRLRAAMHELTSYPDAVTREEQDRVSATSVGFRLEQWRVALMLFQERPLLGYGVGNVGKEVNRYVELEEASRVLYSEPAQRGHPTHLHSAYLDALTHKGLPGLLALLAVLLCPVYIAVRLYRDAPKLLGPVVVNAVAFATFSLTEDPFIRNNFSSTYLIFTLSLLTLLLSQARAGRPAAGAS